MPDVYTFPPVGITAYENSIDDPLRVSVSYSGAARGSQVRANRAIYNISVSGVGTDGNGMGYIETLKQLLKGKLPLVQIDTLPAVWWGQTCQRGEIASDEVVWTSGGDELVWTSGGDDLVWRDSAEITATAGNDGFDYIDITGVPLGVTIYPGEAVQGGGDVAYVLGQKEVTEDPVRLYLTAPIASGEVNIGRKVTRVFRITNEPSAMQTTGAFGYDFTMIEAFETDFPDGFNIRDVPWI